MSLAIVSEFWTPAYHPPPPVRQEQSQVLPSCIVKGAGSTALPSLLRAWPRLRTKGSGRLVPVDNSSRSTLVSLVDNRVELYCLKSNLS